MILILYDKEYNFIQFNINLNFKDCGYLKLKVKKFYII